MLHIWCISMQLGLYAFKGFDALLASQWSSRLCIAGMALSGLFMNAYKEAITHEHQDVHIEATHFVARSAAA